MRSSCGAGPATSSSSCKPAECGRFALRARRSTRSADRRADSSPQPPKVYANSAAKAAGGGAMDFRLTEEQRLVRDTARDFVDRELIPHVRDWEEKGEVPRSFYRKMAGLGFLGAPVPEKYGGAGMDYVSFMLLVEEISRGSSSVRTTVSVQTSLSETSLMWFGSEAQKAKWLVALAQGEQVGARALTQPEAGGDPGDPAKAGKVRGDGWVPNRPEPVSS